MGKKNPLNGGLENREYKRYGVSVAGDVVFFSLH